MQGAPIVIKIIMKASSLKTVCLPIVQNATQLKSLQLHFTVSKSTVNRLSRLKDHIRQHLVFRVIRKGINGILEIWEKNVSIVMRIFIKTIWMKNTLLRIIAKTAIR